MAILTFASRLLRESDGFRVDTGQLALGAPLPAGASVELGLHAGLRLHAGGSQIVLEAEGAATAALAWHVVHLGLGADARYRYVLPFNDGVLLEATLREFFAHARLPHQIESPLAAGESIAIAYGGYLRLSAPAAAASIAGKFAVDVTAEEDLPGWARVVVKRQRAGQMGVAADVKVDPEDEASGRVWNAALHAAYSRSTEQDALLDVCVNLNSEQGREAMLAAGRGDFALALSKQDPDSVRVNEGVFTRRTKAESRWAITLGGRSAEGAAVVSTNIEQRAAKGLRLESRAELKVEQKRRRQQESTHVAFLLRALGQSKGILKGPELLISELTSLSASYNVGFTDDDPSPDELDSYLELARELGLDRYGATLENVLPLLAPGPLALTYEVRFGAKAVAALLSLDTLSQQMEDALRQALRNQVVRNYERSSSLQAVAQCYAVPALYVEYRSLGFAVFSRRHGQLLTTLYGIEDAMIDAIGRLYEVLGSRKPISPKQFEKRLSKFGTALKLYDRFDQGTNSIFFVFDTLIRLASSEEPANIGILRLHSGVGQAAREMAFLTPEAAAH